ncbi:unnamed protein product [Cylindrotheca closterium]|uniref:Leucine-rich repeat-containing N-terminal plant-type domain-containing protein n=1 Tax=Cylindrotheca closterium TaxID=2856 RepID=A0AAD2PWS7_9STRA|nr:unnamed protein product [Cylindrotheca closterium]
MMIIVKLFCLLLLLAWDVCATTEQDVNNMALDGGTVQMQYLHDDGKTIRSVSCPRYFFTLSTANVQAEIKYKLYHSRWSDRVILDLMYHGLRYGDVNGTRTSPESTSSKKKKNQQLKWDILQRNANSHCKWEGIVCNKDNKVTQISLSRLGLSGTLPDELHQMSQLEMIEVNNNKIHGRLHASYGKMSSLKLFNVEDNHLEGSIPGSWSHGMTSMEFFSLAGNSFTGTLPQLDDWKSLIYLDLSRNRLEGPVSLFENNLKLATLSLRRNQLTGTLQLQSSLPEMKGLDLSHNQLSGTAISKDFLSNMPNLLELSMQSNLLTGYLPSELFLLSHLRMLRLSDNLLTGSLPDAESSTGGKWSDMKELEKIELKHNKLTGTLPPNIFWPGNRLTSLDLGFNKFEGKLPTTIKYASKLLHLLLPYNHFEGSIPVELAKTNKNLKFNFTENRFTSIPKELCNHRIDLNQQAYYYLYDCNPLICEKGTFTLNGAQDIYSGCQTCDGLSKPESEYIGRTTCPTKNFTYGDQDMVGELSETEILRLLHAQTGGMYWGRKYMHWGMPVNDPCDHPGITCTNSHVVKIDLSEVSLCTDYKRNPLPDEDCRGIPSELALLEHLEVLNLGKQQHLRGTIPWELGHTKLKYLEITNAPGMNGTIPSSFGHMTNLKVLNLSSCKFNGTIPEEFYELTKLEKLHLNMNDFSGHISSNIQKLTNLKEFMMSRTYLSGTIPEELGKLTAIENLELYGTHLTGNIPASIGNCTNLKRVDMFNNKLTGSLPSELSKLQSLQILHLKLNQLTGTISPNFGELSYLSWFDVSSNKLSGTISPTFGASRSLHDFRVGNNRIYAPIPPSLCKNVHINGGLTATYGCDAIVCPLGTFSETGHAIDTNPGCLACPEGLTSIYLGAIRCELISDHDILNMFYDVLLNDLDAKERKQLGSEMGGGLYRESMIGATNTKEDDDDSDTTGSHSSWKDPSASVCEWKGVRCGSKGEILSFRFPTPFMDE